jgi:hypothetical protein
VLGARLTNATDGGPGRTGYHLSEATKAKLRKAAKKQRPIQHSTVTKEFLRNLQLGRKHSKETKQNLRFLQLGRKHSHAVRANMSRAHGGRPFVELGSGKVFHTQTEATEFFGFKRTAQSKINRVLNGQKPQYKGLRFEYVK